MPLQIIRQDITKMQVDAIVNTTNEEMVGYSGVDFAVHQGAGPLLELEFGKIARAERTKCYNGEITLEQFQTWLDNYK